MWINLRSLPPEGSTITVDDPAVWAVPLEEFGVPCRIVTPLKGQVALLPQNGEGMNGGCLVRGILKGEVALPCNRCAEEAHVLIDSRFESFEPVPVDDDDMDELDTEADDLPEEVDEAVIRLENGMPQINPAALLWEEFLLALPVKPLCQSDCKGVCPVCGKNRNTSTCQCKADNDDPRMAALRGLKVNK